MPSSQVCASRSSAGIIGYFTIARNSTFASHALAHIALPGATGAALLGVPIALGLGVFAVGGAWVIAALGKRAGEREIATGTVLAFATGLGLYFARLSSSASSSCRPFCSGQSSRSHRTRFSVSPFSTPC